ncbi:MAG: TraR/DksA family transcriptional regulator [Armatimonadetes bacterium]|nr:TraR/DksA family transcriptional regulator [Armatimonadota bacterium]
MVKKTPMSRTQEPADKPVAKLASRGKSPTAAKKKATMTTKIQPKAEKRAPETEPGKPSERRFLLQAERERLRREFERAMARVRASIEDSDLESSDEDDLTDAADAIYDRELGVAIAADLRERLRDVEETLKRLVDSDEATCEVCGNEISTERLRWVPSATRCAQCQDLIEGMRRPSKDRNLLGEAESE